MTQDSFNLSIILIYIYILLGLQDVFYQYPLKLQAEADGELLQGGDGDLRLQSPVAPLECEVSHLPPKTDSRD